jgi:hypothetical protein
VSFVILALDEGAKLSIEEQVILGVGVPHALIWAFIGWMAVSYVIQ